MKQQREQEVFKSTLEHAYTMWKTSSMSINQATKLAAKQYKVNADELARYVFEYTKNRIKE